MLHGPVCDLPLANCRGKGVVHCASNSAIMPPHTRPPVCCIHCHTGIVPPELNVPCLKFDMSVCTVLCNAMKITASVVDIYANI